MEYSFLAARLSFTFDVHMCVFHLARQINSAAAAACVTYFQFRLRVCSYTVVSIFNLFRVLGNG